MDDFKGKKLLFLGGTGFMCDAVEKAKSMGIYTIVTDYFPNPPAKGIADQREDISTTDIDALVEFCRNNHVDGVFAGFEDLNTFSAQAVCERMGYPFYATKEQLDVTANKIKFKELCRRHDIPVVKEYPLDALCRAEDLERMEYPVIIKPADSYSSKGVTVCHTKNELVDAVPKALSFSRSKQVIVEKYMSADLYDDTNIDCIFQDGQVYVKYVSDRFTNTGRSIPVGLTSPSIYTSEYLSDVVPKVKEMFRSIGVQNGCAFIQAFHNHEGFHLYEMGFRLPGSQTYIPLMEETGVDELEGMIRLALTGEFFLSDISPLMQSPCQNYYCNLVLSCTGGTISRIEGIEQAKSAPYVLSLAQLARPGDTIEANGTQKQILCRITLKANSRDLLADEIEMLQNSIVVYDQNNNPMMAEMMNTEKIRMV